MRYAKSAVIFVAALLCTIAAAHCLAEGNQTPQPAGVGTIAGRVFDTDEQKPVAGDLIVAVASADAEPHFLRDRVLAYRPKQLEQANFFDTNHYSAYSGKDGTFKIENVPHARVDVFLIRQRGPNLTKLSVSVHEEQTAQVNFDVSAKTPGFLTGRFLKEDGQPIPNRSAHLTFAVVRGDNAASNYDGGTVTSDEDGRYYWQLRGAGSYDIKATLEGYQAASLKLEVSYNSAQIGDFVFKIAPLLPAFGTLSGQVLMPDGKTLAIGVYVTPYSKQRDLMRTSGSFSVKGRPVNFARDRSVQTDLDGKFRIRELPPGDYGVIASPTGNLEAGARNIDIKGMENCLPGISEIAEVKENAIAQVTVTFNLGGSIAGIVTDKETGNPLADANIGVAWNSPGQAPMPGPRLAQVKSDADGKFKVSPLVPGRYQITGIAKNNGQDYSLESQVYATISAGMETATKVDLERKKFGKVSLRVLKPDGTPASGAIVRTGFLNIGPSLGTTNSDGRFLNEKLPTGAYTWTADTDGCAQTETPAFHVDEGKTTEVEVKLNVGGVIEGKALGKNGSPLARMQVCLVTGFVPSDKVSFSPGDNRPRKYVATAEDGSFRLENVPDAPVSIWLQRRDGAPTVRNNLRVKDGETLKQDLIEGEPTK